MFWFKACPRCKGDLYHDGDKYGPYTSCVQCGHYMSPAEEASFRLAAPGALAMFATVDAERVAA